MTNLTVIKDKPPTLKKLQKMVGGWIEIIYFNNGDQMIVNEEGRILNLEPNREASIIYAENKGHPYLICGDVVLLKGKAILS